MAIAPLQKGEIPKTWELTDKTVLEDRIETKWLCRFESGICTAEVSVSAEGVDISTDAESILLPAFDFDGAQHTDLKATAACVQIGYKGWVCRFTADRITDTGLVCGNRNGKYRLFSAQGAVHVAIEKQ